MDNTDAVLVASATKGEDSVCPAEKEKLKKIQKCPMAGLKPTCY